MNIKINETGERKNLVIRSDNGIDWTEDLIGNAGAIVAGTAGRILVGENPQGKFLWSDEDDAYLCDQDTYDWWAEYIENAEQTEIEARDLAERLGVSYTQVIDRIRQHTGLDYDQHRQEAIAAMLDLEAECEPNPPAYVQGGEWVESL